MSMCVELQRRMVGRLLVKCNEKMSPTGMACAKSMGAMELILEAMRTVLSWSQLRLWWVSVAVVQGALSLLLLLVLSLTLRVEPSLGWRVLPPRSYMNLQLSLVLKSLGLPGWLLQLRMLLWLLLLLLRVGLPLMLLGLWLLS